MKKFLLSIAFLFTLFAMLQSCQKEVAQSEKIKEITIDTTIVAGSDYYLNLTPYGDEGEIATILDKGSHFAISQLDNETDVFTSVFHYAPATAFTGKDAVVLSISQNPQGRQACSKDSTIIYVNLTIQ